MVLVGIYRTGAWISYQNLREFKKIYHMTLCEPTCGECCSTWFTNPHRVPSDKVFLPDPPVGSSPRFVLLYRFLQYRGNANHSRSNRRLIKWSAFFCNWSKLNRKPADDLTAALEDTRELSGLWHQPRLGAHRMFPTPGFGNVPGFFGALSCPLHSFYSIPQHPIGCKLHGLFVNGRNFLEQIGTHWDF